MLNFLTNKSYSKDELLKERDSATNPIERADISKKIVKLDYKHDPNKLKLIEKMDQYGVIPEIECFDTGMLNYTNYIISKNILKPPYHINVILGNIYNGQCDLSNLASIKANLPSNSYVLEIGCGNGKNMLYRDDLNFEGIDISEKQFEICKRKGLNVHVSSMCNLPFEDNLFDICDKIYCGSEFIKNDIVKKRIVSPDKFVVTGLPLDEKELDMFYVDLNDRPLWIRTTLATTITPFTPPGPRCLRHHGGRSRPASAEVKAKELLQLSEGDAEVIVVVDAQGWHDAIVLAVAVELQKVSPWEVP